MGHIQNIEVRIEMMRFSFLKRMTILINRDLSLSLYKGAYSPRLCLLGSDVRCSGEDPHSRDLRHLKCKHAAWVDKVTNQEVFRIMST